MKLLGKTKDQAIGSLLRAYVSRPTNPHQACTDFDPDFAAAYVERRLPASAHSRYEAHLSECAACRKDAVALALLAQAESSASSAQTGLEIRAGWLASAGNLVRALSAPQWAMAAAAVVVLAISLPLFLSRNRAVVEQTGDKIDQVAAAENARPQPPAIVTTTDAKLSENSPARVPPNDSKHVENRKNDTSSANGTLASNITPPARNDRGGSGELQNAEAKPQNQVTDQVQVKTESQSLTTQAPAQSGQAGADTQQAKKDSAQQQEKDVAQTTESRPIRADEVSADKEKARQAEPAAAPPAPPESSRVAETSRPLGRSRARLGLRDSSSNESVPPRNADREIRGKRFFLKDGTWTDRDYNPDKDLPVITLVRDSNVYKEVLSKRASLKPYLDQFNGSERAIIVYKGTVYKLIPQKSDK